MYLLLKESAENSEDKGKDFEIKSSEICLKMFMSFFRFRGISIKLILNFKF